MIPRETKTMLMQNIGGQTEEYYDIYESGVLAVSFGPVVFENFNQV